MIKKAASLVLVCLSVSSCVAIGGGAAVTLAPGTRAPAVAATIIAAMHGGLVGGSLGSDLGKEDRRKGLEAEYRALEYTQAGQPVKWQGEGGTNGNVIAAQPYRVGSQDCRQYTHTVTSGPKTQTARGTACRNSDGSWTPLT